jgi:hypothetical protein
MGLIIQLVRKRKNIPVKIKVVEEHLTLNNTQKLITELNITNCSFRTRTAVE